MALPRLDLPSQTMQAVGNTYEAKIRAVVFGSRIRMMTAAKRFCRKQKETVSQTLFQQTTKPNQTTQPP